LRDTKAGDGANIVIGEDWTGPKNAVDKDLRTRRKRRGIVSLNRSPLARKIITFNLMGLIILVAGVLYLNPFRDSLVFQRERGLVIEARLIADVIEAQLDSYTSASGQVFTSLSASDIDVNAMLNRIHLPPGVEVFVYAPSGGLIASTVGRPRPEIAPVRGLRKDERSTLITDFLNRVWEGLSGTLTHVSGDKTNLNPEEAVKLLVPQALKGDAQIKTTIDDFNRSIFSVAIPIKRNGAPVAVVGVTSPAGELDALVRREREQVLQMFVIAILVSIGLSLLLASTIANPLSDLAAAAELGRDKKARKMNPGRVRIPDLTARPDEIGRLSGALRGMVTALYDRIDANEQFAADVAHEIKNPLASLRSAVGTLRVARKDEQRQKLLDVIDHDVRRLDRLVSDISNASRLDSELVKEEEESFDLVKLLENIAGYLGEEAARKGVDFIADLPKKPVIIQGLEARLAQVFVNLITNAISFCEEGDAIRVWVRKRENRVLVVVEDTGPGIPNQALHKIFNRFYSERPAGQFGNNSGLGLAISKQIVEAHGGVIWAENIRPTEADVTSEPLGARFVVGLPV